MENFEEVLTQYEPMISAAMRKLNIYRDHESFRQAGRVALWQAWTRYEEGTGHFAPFASVSIRGAMLDLIKKEVRFEENVIQTEDDVLEFLNDTESTDSPTSDVWSDRLRQAFKVLNNAEREFIQWYFLEGLSQAECAEKAGVSVAGIKKRRQRMILKLREALQDCTSQEVTSI
ncbi:sigma-70 family RNA polymerase sigma factor [Sporosarcina sp. 6E9]|uniref:sigma-70 family RNA polymerase sigma factor n=1 Tax=Sporosarcina sp. 6E9 TaxID=2819235 RepID=UPI001ACB87FF|nr:sigma-70 family RNA polymerase sigma factor [Sporosarcina sp. 6E9]MBO1910379.1 sigma-70 family RNA polymerase sigma factor [Microvirga sp. 3-52]